MSEFEHRIIHNGSANVTVIPPAASAVCLHFNAANASKQQMGFNSAFKGLSRKDQREEISSVIQT